MWKASFSLSSFYPLDKVDKVFLPADKGSATVVMRREEYEAKMRELNECPTYRCIRQDSTAMHETRLNRILRSLREDDEITEGLYHELRPTGSQPPEYTPPQDP